MIPSIPGHAIREIPKPLPPSWLRRAPTQPDRPGEGRAVLRVSPEGAVHRAILETIGKAKEIVLLASFLFADEGITRALLDAAGRGVRVYVLTASNQTLQKFVDDDEVGGAKEVEAHKRLLDQLASKVLLRSADHFHAKFVVADPWTTPRGHLSTANFNKALHESVELCVPLGAEAARQAATCFMHAFWAEAESELTEPGRLGAVRPPPAAPRAPAFGVIVATTKSHTALRDAVSSVIAAATQTLTITTFGLDATHPLVDAIIEKAQSGVAVTVLTRPRPAVQEAVTRLEKAGVRVLAHDKLHAKAVVSDAGALVMTANFATLSLESSFELGILLADEAADELRRVLADWAEGFPWTFASAASRESHLGEICLADRGLREGIRRVFEVKDIPAENIVADDALKLEQANEPVLKLPPMDEFPHKVRYTWTVRPPCLPKGAVERKREIAREETGKDGKSRTVKVKVSFEPKVFELGKQVFVLLSSIEQRDAARRLADDLGARVVVP
jgi:cardiolipin synthase